MTLSLIQHLERLKSSENLLKEVRSLDVKDMEAFYQRVDESSFSVSDWAEALVEITKFSEKTRQNLSLQHRLEYLSCCAESQDRNGPMTDLKSVLEHFLSTYGVE